MSVTVESVKNSLRLEEDFDDKMIQGYIDTAENYVVGAVGSSKEELSKYPQFDFAVSMLVQFYYYNRTDDMKATPYQVVSMIQQLRGFTGIDQ